MALNTLHNFTGSDLKVVDIQDRHDNCVTVGIIGKQEDPDFLEACTQHPNDIQVTVRRLLEAHGITFALEGLEFHQGRREIEAFGTLRRVANNIRVDILPLIDIGSYITRPHNFRRRGAIDNDRLRFTLSQQFISMGHQHLDLLPDKDNPDVQFFEAAGEAGQLIYYPATPKERLPDVMAERLRYKPGNVDRYSSPVWQSHHDRLIEPNELVAMRVKDLSARFHTLSFATCNGQLISNINSPRGTFHVFDTNHSDHSSEMTSVPMEITDRRNSSMALPQDEETHASKLLTASYKEADAFIERLTHFSGKVPEERPSAIVVNEAGRAHINHTFDSPFVATASTTAEEENLTERQRSLSSSLSSPHNPVAEDSTISSVIRLLRTSDRLGLDGRAIIACESFPQHAALDVMNGSEVNQKRQVFNTLLFRNASTYHSQFFSKHDYNSMWNLLGNGIDVFWAHPGVKHREKKKWHDGTLLQLTKLDNVETNDEIFTSMAFVPVDRRDEFLNGIHHAFYGTARRLGAEYLTFMEKLFDVLAQIRKEQDKPFVIESGGGPNISTMGISNMHGRKKNMLSIGHVLGVKKEPMNEYLDGMMPMRNNARDLRQGNMAAGANIVWSLEGGGGTREERGISQTDIAIARVRPYPIVLVGSEYYKHEYQQYLHEVSAGNLDANVLNCISLIDTNDIDSAEQIARALILKGKVKRIIPERFRTQRARAIRKHNENIESKREAWH